MEKNMFIIVLILCFIAKNKTEAFSRFRAAKSRQVSSTYRSRKFDAKMELLSEEILEHSKTDSVMMKKADKITRLPGQPNDVVFKQYGGYVTVNSTTGRALYYYFVEAHKSPDTMPLILWLNGGPGCSSLGYGAFTELGPFRVKSDGKTLFKNEYAWNKVANVLFLESPVGVGFSYSNKTDENMKGDDETTAIENYVFLRKWLKRFPEYKARPFYICGESYAGYYVPQLAEIIIYKNKKAAKNIVNLKGVLLGNAEIDDETEFPGMVENYASHALISDDKRDALRKYCNFSINLLPDKCFSRLKEANQIVDKLFNVYNIYYHLCSNPNVTHNPKKASIFKFNPCSDHYVEAYMNRADVQKALHANAIKRIPYAWEVCRKNTHFDWGYTSFSQLPQLKLIMNNDIPIWLYSGDVDARVPVKSTQLALKKMKLKTKKLWRPWSHITKPNEVAGFTQEYVGNLTFATVLGAGHMVPSYQPSKAFVLISRFIANLELPKLHCHSPEP